MSNSSSILSTFQSALETLYGPLSLSSLPNPSTWTPPQSSGGHKGRYLWTDAFGVLSLLTLHTEVNRNPATKDAAGDTYLTLASRLVEAVHNTLGYTRDGSRRLSGASDSNPLGGGLRIGKLDEYGSDGDGQYHHYLTLWMFALNRMSVATGDVKYNEQGIALAKAIHGAFFMNRASERARMVWKMDMELNRVLVGSEGNLDPIDGFVVFRLLQAAHAAQSGGDGEVLKEEIEDYARVMRRKGEHFVSADPLDLGMTMWTAHWVVHEEWAAKLAERCFEQIYDLFEIDRYLERSRKYRLAFREFGTALGVRCMAEQDVEKERSVDLRVYADRIVESWGPHMEASMAGHATPADLKPITRVMYAAALIPGGT
ncbi:hypothetical protein ASPVEDRAFT_54294 [Aspergillus versicolor CBS 583.65]|uniref:Uncharacterized protein n=1 Tax=Aspergillus versicolor CBS 583.65 TaxID=1036611 RepID=A0A1L9PRD1_ASPVE|nr:uncharacterized protein ASPVEDRAFT_54294 [Aspergillus versicolor CBS 583.65]OJJ04053.1 hypothetical protein ASPVEDRAFT_54294 [Aspergillus versicolor CBS 583.65]